MPKQDKQEQDYKFTRYKGFIVCGNSIWFDEPKWYECRSFQRFVSEKQAIEYIDNY